MKKLRCIDDELVFIQLLASRVNLLDENYPMTKALSNIEDRHKIDRAFSHFLQAREQLGWQREAKSGGSKESCWLQHPKSKNFFGFTAADSRISASVFGFYIKVFIFKVVFLNSLSLI